MKININLLPPELSSAIKDRGRKTLIVRASVIFLIIMIGITSVFISVILAQSLQFKEVEQKLAASESDIAGLKNQEGILINLKSRVDGINNLYNAPSPQADAFNLMTSLMPGGMSLNTFTINKQNNLVLGGETSSTKVLETFFTNLTDPTEHLGQISTVKLDSLARNQNGSLRFDLTITLTGQKLSQNK